MSLLNAIASERRQPGDVNTNEQEEFTPPLSNYRRFPIIFATGGVGELKANSSELLGFPDVWCLVQ